MSREEALGLLSRVSLGRVVFTDQGLPAIRPVNHLIDDGSLIIRTHLGSTLSSLAHTEPGPVLAYEADDIDPGEHLGWSVVVVGSARLVDDAADTARYERILQPWVTQHPMTQIVRISPDLVTGFWLTDQPIG